MNKHILKEDLVNLFNNIPRKKFAFLPTPLHKLENISKEYNVNIYMKREEFPGPSTFVGNKIRKLEFIMGQALEDKITHVITYGGYQSNSCVQVATTCNASGIKPILFLGDTKTEGIPKDPTGNLLISRILGAEIHYVEKPEPQDSTMIIILRGDKAFNML